MYKQDGTKWAELGSILEILASKGEEVGRSLEPRPVILRFEWAQETPGDLVTGLWFCVGLKCCLSNKLPWDANVAGQGHTLRN